MPHDDTAMRLSESSLSLRPAGARGATPAVWSLRVGCGALVIGAAFAGWSALRPLPEPRIDAPASIPQVRNDFGAARNLETRDSLLARLGADGNIFAPDRAAWSVRSAQRNEQGEDVAENDASGKAKIEAKLAAEVARLNESASTAPASFDSIPIAEKPPAGLAKDLNDLRLRGVYTTPQGAVAMIGTIRQKNSKSAEPRRVGDVFGDQEWELLAIDEVGKRVILSRAGVNVQLAMWAYESKLAKAAASPAPPPVPEKPSVVVYSRTPEQVRSDLAAAGVSSEEIDELLALSEDAKPEPAVADAAPAGGIPAMPEAPAAMVDLLKMMSSDAGMRTSTPSHRRERTRFTPPPTEPQK